MQFVETLLNNLAYLNPIPLPGWLVWLGLAGLLGIALFHWRKYHIAWNTRATLILAALAIVTPFAALFFGLEFSTGSTLPVPGLPEEPAGSTIQSDTSAHVELSCYSAGGARWDPKCGS